MDVGDLIQLSSSISPHDVGALLKEYFRDLPEPLLTRELYTAFVGTASKLSINLNYYLQKIVFRFHASLIENFDGKGTSLIEAQIMELNFKKHIFKTIASSDKQRQII